jgi:hypothetical protein
MGSSNNGGYNNGQMPTMPGSSADMNQGANNMPPIAAMPSAPTTTVPNPNADSKGMPVGNMPIEED